MGWGSNSKSDKVCFIVSSALNSLSLVIGMSLHLLVLGGHPSRGRLISCFHGDRWGSEHPSLIQTNMPKWHVLRNVPLALVIPKVTSGHTDLFKVLLLNSECGENKNLASLTSP